MTRRFLHRLVLCAMLWPTTAAADAPVRWQGWSEDLFARARAERRFVRIDMEAVWCHWCHVMDQQTYADPARARVRVTA